MLSKIYDFGSLREHYVILIFVFLLSFGGRGFIWGNFCIACDSLLPQFDISRDGVSWRMGLLFNASNLDWDDMMTDMTRMALLFCE